MNFSRGSSIVRDVGFAPQNILNSHIRAIDMSSYKAATAAQLQFTEVWHYSSPQPSSILCLMRLGNISKYSTFVYCENVWEKKIRSRLKHPVYAEDFQIGFTAEGLISCIWLQSLILFFRVICLLRCPGNFTYKENGFLFPQLTQGVSCLEVFINIYCFIGFFLLYFKMVYIKWL